MLAMTQHGSTSRTAAQMASIMLGWAICRGAALAVGLTACFQISALSLADHQPIAGKGGGRHSFPMNSSALAAGQKNAEVPKSGSEFRDCANCPAMIVIPAGRFTMGSPKDDGAPKDGSAWALGDPDYRVARGGSWRNDTSYLRAAAREKRNFNVRFDTLGFRVARELNP